MIVVFTFEADTDVERIGDHISRDNPTRAISFVKEIRECCERLGDMPEAYPYVPRYEHLGVRRRVFGDYLIFYRVRPTRVEIIHILHGAMDYERILFPER
jgi:plasmid stabilization system protein ParE